MRKGQLRRRRNVRPAPDRPIPRTDANSQLAHEQLLEKAKKGGIDVYFVGDSITRRWGTSDPQYKDLLANWNGKLLRLERGQLRLGRRLRFRTSCGGWKTASWTA